MTGRNAKLLRRVQAAARTEARELPAGAVAIPSAQPTRAMKRAFKAGTPAEKAALRRRYRPRPARHPEA